MSGFSNAVVGGYGILKRIAIQSPNYVPLTSGWTINKDGSAEFQNLIARGTLIADTLSATSIGGSSIVNSDFQGGTMEETSITFDNIGGRILVYSTTKSITTFNTAGVNVFTPPAGITTIQVELIGGGGAGATGSTSFGGAGGGGGEYSLDPNVTVTPLANYNAVVGASGIDSTFPGDTKTVRAHHGNNAGFSVGGAGGSGSVSPVHFNGGSGASVPSNNTGGAGGGGSAGTSARGNNGTAPNGATHGNGGAAVTGGGAGGNGGDGGLAGNTGSVPGGGGGGGGAIAHIGGAGGTGSARITYTVTQSLIGAIAPMAGTDAANNAYGIDFTGTITAFQPGAAPSAVEVWHSLGTLSGFTVNIGRYKLRPDNHVEFDINVTGLGANAASTTFQNALPAAYRPVSDRRRVLGIAGTSSLGTVEPNIFITATSGAVTIGLNSGVANGTIVYGGADIPLD